jgi:hypothetical protein
MSDIAKTLQQLRQERSRTEKQLSGLDEAISVLGKLVTGGTGRTGKRRLSVAARRRIAQAQKLRWAKWKAKQEKKAA